MILEVRVADRLESLTRENRKVLVKPVVKGVRSKMPRNSKDSWLDKYHVILEVKVADRLESLAKRNRKVLVKPVVKVSEVPRNCKDRWLHDYYV